MGIDYGYEKISENKFGSNGNSFNGGFYYINNRCCISRYGWMYSDIKITQPN